MSTRFTRRHFLRTTAGLIGVSALGGVLQACSSQPAQPAATAAPKATEAAKPAATTAPAPAATQAPAAPSGKKIAIRLGHIAAPNQPPDQASKKFSQLAADKSKGELDIQIFPSSQLGSEDQLFQGVRTGTIEMCLNGEGQVGKLDARFNMFIVPFLIPTDASYEKLIKSDLTKKIQADFLQKSGGTTRIIGGWYRSARHIGHKTKAIRNLDEAKGVKLRVAEVPLYTDAYRDIGFAVTPMSWGELYTALQQGVVESMEAQLEWFTGSSLFEVEKALTLSGHAYGNYVCEINEAFFQSLSKPNQQALLDAYTESTAVNEQLVKQWDKDQLAVLQTKGMTVTQGDQVDKKAFQKIVMEKSIPRYEAAWGKGFIDEILKNL
ncbi:MAG: TRAP transporter substrate-binding protein [Chloroflexota bacterium]